MSRDFAVIRSTFWKRGTGKRLRGKKEAQILALYLMSAPDAESIGIYHCELEEMAHHTGLSLSEVKGALVLLAGEDFAHFDPECDLVWVPNLARERFGDTMSPKDKKRAWVEKEVRKIRSHRFVVDFYTRYGEAYGLERGDHLVEPQAPSKPLRSPYQPLPEGASSFQEGTSSDSDSSSDSSSDCVPRGRLAELDIATKARLYRQSKADAQTLALDCGEPVQWPEVRCGIELFKSLVHPESKPVRVSSDSRVLAILDFFAAEQTPAELEELIRLAAADKFWRGKPLPALLKDPGRLDALRLSATTTDESELSESDQRILRDAKRGQYGPKVQLQAEAGKLDLKKFRAYLAKRNQEALEASK